MFVGTLYVCSRFDHSNPCVRFGVLLQYMVKRKGLDFTEYGLVDARAAKRQRLTGDNNDPKYALLSPA